MSYLQAFTEKLTALNVNLDNYFRNSNDYRLKIPHQLLGSIIVSAEGAFNFAQKNSMDLVQHLKIQEAFANHKLEDEKMPTKLLRSAIAENPVQFENAFELHTRSIKDKIYEFTQNIAHAKTVTDTALAYADLLLNADWRPGDEKPIDEKPKWVWLTDGFFTKLEKEARYDLQKDEWIIKQQTPEPYFTIHNWTDISAR